MSVRFGVMVCVLLLDYISCCSDFILRTSETAGCIWSAIPPFHVLPMITHTSLAWSTMASFAPTRPSHPQRHILTAALGAGNGVTPDFPSEPFRSSPGTCWCSAPMVCGACYGDHDILEIAAGKAVDGDLSGAGGDGKKARRPRQHHSGSPATELNLKTSLAATSRLSYPDSREPEMQIEIIEINPIKAIDFYGIIIQL